MSEEQGSYIFHVSRLNHKLLILFSHQLWSKLIGLKLVVFLCGISNNHKPFWKTLESSINVSGGKRVMTWIEARIARGHVQLNWMVHLFILMSPSMWYGTYSFCHLSFLLYSNQPTFLYLLCPWKKSLFITSYWSHTHVHVLFVVQLRGTYVHCAV